VAFYEPPVDDVAAALAEQRVDVRVDEVLAIETVLAKSDLQLGAEALLRRPRA